MIKHGTSNGDYKAVNMNVIVVQLVEDIVRPFSTNYTSRLILRQDILYRPHLRY